MEKLNRTNITEFSRGLHTDTSPVYQPKGTQRFVLNGVSETNQGDELSRSNEESNEAYATIKSGYVLLGKTYMEDNKVALFLVSQDNSTSEIGILEGKNNYVTHVNDALSADEDKLGFDIGKQIQATFRLRRGCERTVYWTDDNKKPGYYNFDKPKNFQNPDGTWAATKFNLFRSYSSIPNFQKLEVSNSGGMLKPGSINVAIQLLDEGLNPSEWIITSDTINIYNDSTTKPYSEILGSVVSDKDFLKFPTTTKSLKIKLSNLDQDWAYYRIAFIESNQGDGLVSDVKISDNIPISKNSFIYTGENAPIKGTQEELLFFNEVIYKAGSIEQIENRLVLANTQGKQVNMCKLQKYASKIQADCITKPVVLNDITDQSNPKNPLINLNGTGYMPGEIYSFGIVYVFNDGTLSPVFHIPGRNNTVEDSLVYNPLKDAQNNPITFPMSKDNSCFSTYTDNNQCDETEAGMWGLDSEGDTLLGKPIRHHRFPLRTDINKGLVNKRSTSITNRTLYYIELKIEGTLKTPITCSPGESGCTPQDVPDFNVRVSYNNGGESFSFTLFVSPALYADNTGSYNTFISIENSQYHNTNDFTNIVIEYTDLNGNYIPEVDGYNLYFTNPYAVVEQGTSIKTTTSSIEGAEQTTDILGINFSNIEMPSLADTNGEKIVGYYIVRNERGEFDKTIIDSGVMIPSLINDKYVSHGLLAPEVNPDKISKNVYGLIHPEHKFNNKEYTEYDEIIQQGNYNVVDRKKSKIMYNDVLDGSSFQKGQKDGNDDGQSADKQPLTRGMDGWSLTSINRDNIVEFETKSMFTIPRSKIKESFYLNALESKDILDNTKSVFNIAADNKVGMLHFNEDSLISDSMPYVLLKRYNSDPYSNFRTLPYYKETNDMVDFSSSSCSVFNGDTYVTSMRYVNTLFWDNRVAKRKAAGTTVFGTFIPGGIGKWIAGAILIALGTVLLAVGGSGALVIGAGIAVIGGGALFVASGIEASAVEKAYLQEYDKGLRKTALDNWVDSFYNFKNDIPFGFNGNGGHGGDGPSDDTIEWVGDCITDLWFDSPINMSLRNTMTSDASTFLSSPGIIESGNDTPINTWEFFGINYTNGNSARYPISKLDYHMAKKLLVTDQDRNDSKYYIGLPFGEYYNVNPDYMRKNKQKIYYHLPFEYDCCSECQEDFPHRWHWSEQSLQEELSDNYRTFLPNNYKDLEGETGEITNVFRLGDELYIHTREALWKVPRNMQERITDEVVSFIGTGEYGSIPPKKIIDDETGNSAGCQHKWGVIKTPEGIFFPSSNQGIIYQFNGAGLSPISNAGVGNWFKNNMNFLMDENYYEKNGRVYPYVNNPSNTYGTGFISTYDSRKQRVIFTKKDFVYHNDSGTDYEVSMGSQGYVKFPNFTQIINTKKAAGWNYIGMENSRMKFERSAIGTTVSTRETTVNATVSNGTTIHVFYDTTSMGQSVIDVVKASIVSWYQATKPEDPLDANGNGLYLKHHLDGTERWLSFPSKLIPGNTGYVGTDETGKDVIVLSFVDEANPIYHPGVFDNPINMTGDPQPTSTYIEDYNLFTGSGPYVGNGIYQKFKSFVGINYPILRGATGNDVIECLSFLQHSIAAIYGRVLTIPEADGLEVNSNFSTTQWQELKESLMRSNPYDAVLDNTGNTGLLQYNWRIKTNKNVNGSGATASCPASTEIMTSCNFAEDIQTLLSDINTTTTSIITKNVDYVYTEYSYVDGTPFVPVINNNSWTVSYSLKQKSWISWHSYLPSFYINTPKDFFSWKPGNNSIWRHNKKNDYQRFYGNNYPFIIEYVSLSNPLINKIWDDLKILADVKIYDSTTDEYYDTNDTFFTSFIAYNSRQCTGEKQLSIKKLNLGSDYLGNQIVNPSTNTAIVNRNEGSWTINDLRDIRTNYNTPIFKSDLFSKQTSYFIDKVLNNSSMNVAKDWTEMESFRDKYLVVRLRFNNFAKENTKISMNFSLEDETQSFR